MRLTVRPSHCSPDLSAVSFALDILESGVFESVLEWGRRAFLNHWGMYNSSLILL